MAIPFTIFAGRTLAGALDLLVAPEDAGDPRCRRDDEEDVEEDEEALEDDEPIGRDSCSMICDALPVMVSGSDSVGEDVPMVKSRIGTR